MVNLEQGHLSAADIQAVLRQPNGFYLPMELVRTGRAESSMAVAALRQFDKKPFFKRLLLAFVDSLFPRGGSTSR